MAVRSKLAAVFYLAFTISLAVPLSATAQATAQNFPEGPGKQTFTAVCGACHDINCARPKAALFDAPQQVSIINQVGVVEVQ